MRGNQRDGKNARPFQPDESYNARYRMYLVVERAAGNIASSYFRAAGFSAMRNFRIKLCHRLNSPQKCATNFISCDLSSRGFLNEEREEQRRGRKRWINFSLVLFSRATKRNARVVRVDNERLLPIIQLIKKADG